MTVTLDVMLIEAEAGAATVAVRELEAAGHRVHRCHDPGGAAFPCKGVADAVGCPLARHLDVALLVRSSISPEPVAREQGVGCAIRAGVPIVEDGLPVVDPFADWLAGRVDAAGVVAACEVAAEGALEPLRRAISDRIAPLLLDAAIVPCAVTTSFAVKGPRFVVTAHGPAVPPSLEAAIAVRVLDAVRAAPNRRACDQVDVAYEVG